MPPNNSKTTSQLQNEARILAKFKPTPAPPRERKDPDDGRVEKALRLTYKVVLPRLLRSEMEARLGVASPAYNRSGVRDQAYYEALAAELGDWFFAEIGPIDRANKLDESQARARRLERGHLEDAATELVDIVHAMLPPVRRVVESRSAGHSWKRIAADNPTRAFFSLRDDYAEALAGLWDDHEELIRRLS